MLKNTLASGSTRVSAKEVMLTGDHKAGGNLTVSGQTALTLDQAHLAAEKNLQLATDGKLTQNGGAFTAATDTTLTAKISRRVRMSRPVLVVTLPLTLQKTRRLRVKISPGRMPR